MNGEPNLKDDVLVRSYNIRGTVVAKFYYEDVKNFIKIDDKLANKTFPGWKNKPIYLIIAYSNNHCGEKYVCLHDILCLSSELN